MTSIEEYLPHEVCEVICLKCLKRWISVYPEKTPLKELECPCGEVGYVIKTGQTLPDVDDPNMENDIRYQNMVRMWGEEIAKQKYREFCKTEE